eukprot:CAMPEP_0172459308 /NCGR_PEP_ID=MMETSP1065-20121228/31971_1 /TAXON_ID=265537 /ORGANISM="Amphiprora paludosa, Strain CCMP125" /LENGTH=786 /DNA_ID=CAMNT_0013213935 /DNA_START=122 /DNA_END=2482 /DNA_ORIENTATION=-
MSNFPLRVSAAAVLATTLLTATSSLSWSGGCRRRHTCANDEPKVRSAASRLFMTVDPVRESALKAFDVQASAATFSSEQAAAAGISPQQQQQQKSNNTNKSNSKNTNSNNARRRKRQKEWKARRSPTVDSTLLRFIGQQKESLLPAATAPTPLARKKEATLLAETLPYQDNPDVTKEKEQSSTPTTMQVMPNGKEEALAANTVNLPAASGWGQYNSHRVEKLLLSKDESLDPAAVAKAAARVQAQVLARTMRRRIRTFLKERDETWKSSADAPSLNRIQNSPSPDHSLEESMEVLMSHGLTAKDITDILQHSPGIMLMRPRRNSNDEIMDGADEKSMDDNDTEDYSDVNGECLDDTVDRVFKILCVTLKLRQYDARKIVRASPGLLTMRGSKSAEAMVSLFHRMGVSHTALARDKAALTVALSRSPSSMFRLVAFLASDAIRMPVGKVGPLLRRPVSRALLDAVAPLPQQQLNNHNANNNLISNNGSNMTTTSTAPLEALESELDPWIVSALWGKQSQVRRDQTNDIYKKMTKTAWTLRNQIGTADLGKVVAAYPSVLLLDAQEQILPNAEYLMDNLGICEGDLPRVLQLYPSLLGLPIERMEAVANFLRSLGVESEEMSSMFRSFPALLTLDVETNMKPVVAFLHSIGVMDIGRFLTRIPPILGYSVDQELMPKWKHLKMVSSDARFEVTKFPAYFSYPLERVIKARYEYIQDVKRFPAQLINVEKVVSYGDLDFATKILRDNDDGLEFRAFLDKRKETLRPLKKKRALKQKDRPGPTLQPIKQV